MYNMKMHKLSALAIVAILAGTAAHGNPVLIQDVSDWNNAEEVNVNLSYAGYNGAVYAGINTLQVTANGQTFNAQGFCIDPYHASASGTYAADTVALSDAPKSPGPMSPQAALQVEDLWAMYFNSALTSSSAAGGLQLAIWEVVSASIDNGNGFSLADGVTEAFGYYHADARRCEQAPNGHIIADDGRRFLKRTDQKFDVIVVEPPPPVVAAGSSLLFSTEFYSLAKEHLNPGGIIRMWYPGGDQNIGWAVLHSMQASFPYVRCFPSANHWGVHILGSMTPMDRLTGAELASRMPASAEADLLEWSGTADAARYLDDVVKNEYRIPKLSATSSAVQVTDDKPYNEYFLLRAAFMR